MVEVINKNNKGFTLVELLAVIAIIGILSVVAIGVYRGVSNNSKQKAYEAKIEQINNLDNISIDAGNKIEVNCKVTLPDISVENIVVEVYAGKITDNGTIENITIMEMDLAEANDETREYLYKAKLELTTGGNYGYTFRVMPKHEMLLDSENLDLVKWIEK